MSVAILAPVHARGWPMDIPEPHTLTRSLGVSGLQAAVIGLEARPHLLPIINLIRVKPALFKAREATAGPMPIMVGSPTTAELISFILGFNPKALQPSAVANADQLQHR